MVAQQRCPNRAYTPMQSHRISAGAIIEQNDKLLLVRHVREGRYDFRVAPGGGVMEGETLEKAAAREVLEETGLVVRIGRLLYIEDLASPECRFVKFWFAAEVVSGALSTAHPAAKSEHITEAAWLSLSELEGKPIFPLVLGDRFAKDKELGFPQVVRLPLRNMEFY